MAISNASAAAASLTRAGAYLDPTSDWTLATWYQPFTDAPSGGTFREVWNWGDAAGINPYLYLGSETDTTNLIIEVWDGANLFDSSAYVPTLGVWIYLTLTYTASTTTLTLYINGVSQTTLVNDLSAITFVETQEDALAGNGKHHALEYWRVWQAALTPTQMLAEMDSVDPVVMATILSDARLAAVGNLTDPEAAPPFTVGTGTYSYLSGPLPPVNLTPTLATAITTLPYTLASLDVQDAPTASLIMAATCSAVQGNEVWFTYTTSVVETLLSVTCASVLGTGNYFPRISIWTGTLPSTLTQYTVGTGGDENEFCSGLGGTYFTVPVTPSTTYYFRLNHNTTTQPLNDTLTLGLEAAPAQLAGINDILIPDDADGFPAMVISASTGELLASLPFPAGEFEGVLADGSHCVVDGAASTAILVYDAQFNPVGTHDFTPSLVKAITSNFLDTFFVATRDGTNATVIYTVDAAGTVGGTTWTMTDTGHRLLAMAVSRSSAVLYYTGGTTSVVYAYDLVNDVDLPNLHAAFAGERPFGSGCGFVDPSGNVWFGFATDAFGANGKIRQIDSGGTVLQTWTVVNATYTLLNKFVLAPDQTSLVCWTFTATSSLARFQRLQLSDQSVLDDASGVSVEDTSGGPDADQWSISNSCPLIVLWAAVSPITTGIDPIRRLRRFEIAYDRHLMQFLRRIEFYCQPGTGLVTGQGSDPTLMFRLSKDGGITWGTEQTMSIGAMGDYTARAYLIGLGSGRHLVGEISCSDPTTFALVDCLADLDGGTS